MPEWEAGDPIYSETRQSVLWPRPMAEVLDDLKNCWDGSCLLCQGERKHSAMVVEFDKEESKAA